MKSPFYRDPLRPNDQLEDEADEQARLDAYDDDVSYYADGAE